MAIGVRSSSYTPTSGAGDVNGNDVRCNRPSGVAAGDLLLAFVSRSPSARATDYFSSPGWTYAAFYAGSSEFSPVGVLWRAAGPSEPSSYEFTSVGYYGDTQFIVHILALTGVRTTDPFLTPPVKDDEGSRTSAIDAPSVTPSAGGGLLVCHYLALYYGSASFSAPVQMTERVDRGGAWLHTATCTEPRPSPGATGSRRAGFSRTPAERPRALSLVLRQGAGPPIVSAGADVTLAQYASLQRTAGEDDQDSPVTARTWTVHSGPTGVGDTLATTAALSWTPYTPGSYVLRYTATNAEGTDTDDVTVAVTEVAHPLTATLGLTGGVTEGVKQGRAARTARVRLDAGVYGLLTHRAPARLRLAMTVSGQGSPRASGVLRLTGTVTPGHRTAGGAQHAELFLTTERRTSSRRITVNRFGALTLFGIGAGERLTGRINAVGARPSLAINYELICAARIPQASGPPTFLQIDPISWTGLSYTDELSKPSQLSAGAQVSALSEPILQRLRDLAHNPTELWLYRNGRLVFAGPLLGWQVQGEAITFNGKGLLAYLDMMIVQTDLVYAQVDQSAIATGLIGQWQNLPYGHFGIDTTDVAPTGVLRDATYLAKELHPVGQRVLELGARINGFGVTIDPATRKLELDYPQRGQDRSEGPEAVVFDARNVTSPNVICSSAPGDVASEAYGTGTGSGGAAETVYSVAVNEDLRARYGRAAVWASFDGVSEQDTLDDHTAGLLVPRDTAFLVPGPDTRVTPDSDLSTYDVGDIVSYQLHERLSVQGAFRLRKRQVTVSKTGQEAVTAGLE